MWYKKTFQNIIFLCLLSMVAEGQTYYNVNVFTGTQTVGGITATVSISGTVTTGGGNNCGIVPWWAHSANAEVKIVFSSPISVIRSHLTWVNSGDTMDIKFNGSMYTVASSNLTYYAGTCSTASMAVIAHNGEICGLTCGTQSTAEFDATPGFGVDSVEFIVRTSNCGGIGLDFFFSNNCPGAVTASATHDTVCAGDTLHLFADTTAVSSTATYSWSGPNSFSSSLRNPVLNNVSALAAGTYTVTVTDTGSCTYISSLNITVNAVPSVAVLSNSPLCPGDTLKLFSTAFTNATYSWSGPNSFSSASQNPLLTPFAITDTGTYHLTTTLNGCSAATSTHVSLNTLPTPFITYNSPVCPGDTLKLNANSVSPGVTYSWTGPNSFSSSIQDPVIPNAQAVNGGTYTVTVTNGCSGTTSSAVIINPVLGPPVVTISVSPKDTVCAGDNITLTAIASNAGNAPTYQWKRNGANIAGATAAIFTTGNIANNDLISCKVTSNAPCQPTDTASSNTIHMHVLSLAPPLVSITTYPLNYSNGATITFTGHVPNGSSGLTYQWVKNGVKIPGATNIFYTSNNLTTGDSICLIVHSSVPCTFPDSTITCIGLTTGIDNIVTGIGSVNIYPNPNKGSFTIWGKVFNSSEATIEIIDMLGQVVYKEPVKIENALLEKQITLDKTAAGIYTLLIRTENEMKVFKLVINM